MRNEATLNAISVELQRNCGDILAACRAVGVSLIFVNQWRKDDKDTDATLTEAERVGTQGLVSAAIRRAVHGVPKGVYFKGVKVDEEVVYSDGLLQTLLKAKVPEFAKEGEGGNVNVQVNVANLMPRADNYEQWLMMKQQTLAPPANSLEHGTVLDRKVLEAEFVEIDLVEEASNRAFAGVEL
jgi:hypothetical protein